MSASTTRLALYKPGGGLTGAILPDEVADIDKINSNMDLIDAAIGLTICTSTTRPATPYNGQPIYETDTKNEMYWSQSLARWVPIGIPNAIDAAARTALYPAPVNGDLVKMTTELWPRRYSSASSSWKPYGSGLLPVVPTSVAGATLSATGLISFSSVATFSVNNCHSVEFDNYEYVWKITGAGGSIALTVRLRNAGVDYATANQVSVGTDTTPSTGPTRTGGTAQSWMTVGRVGNFATLGAAGGSFTGFSPFLAERTFLRGKSVDNDNYMCDFAGIHGSVASSFDGLSFFSNNGLLLTGTLRIYGYNDN